MLGPSVVYDIESFPNCFTITIVDLWSNVEWYFEISVYRDDRAALGMFFNWCRDYNIYMIGFNNIGYDYPVIHDIYSDLQLATPAAIYAKSMSIINGSDRFDNIIWENNRFAPQIDLYKIHHFDNKAKSASLKSLQINMRSENVMESPIPFGTHLTADDIERHIKPYNRHDTLQTKKFCHISMPMIDFRLKLKERITGDVLNFNDTKIGKQYLIQKLGDVCYYRDQNGRKQKRQTVRDNVNLGECIFPYIQFKNVEFNRILQWMKAQTITETKGVFTDTKTTINDVEYNFGTGGIHGSLKRAKFQSDDQWAIIDDDVTSLYPSIAIVNRLYPEHLGEAYVTEYAGLKAERVSYAKGTPENGMLKLGLNGTYGDSGNPHSEFRDIKYMLSTTLNGQLILCMYAEWLMTVPTLRIIQINTDGVTYHVHKTMLWMIEPIRKAWQQFTMLDLEQAEYKRMWIRDVNNYIAETFNGKLKLKGAYFIPKDSADIQAQSPPAWHKDFSNLASIKAAREHMLNGTDIPSFIVEHITDPYDFMCREKVKRSDLLELDGVPMQKTMRYYVAINGGSLRKIAPSTHPHRDGWYKPSPKTPDADYIAWHNAHGNVHNPEIHTKNKSIYENRISAVQAGMKVCECNHVNSFRFDNLNYDWYISEANKLVIR